MTAQFDRVEVKGLVKVYGATRALVGVSARFDAEAVTVIEGPNGSGKSTLLNILGQLVKPTRGEVRYGEHEGKSSIALRAAIGILAHAPMIYPDLSSAENLRLFARLHGLPSTAEHVAGASHASGRASATQVPPTQRASAQLATGAQSASAAHSGGGHEASVPSTHSRLPQSPRMQVSVISSQVTPAQLRGITTVRIRGPSGRKTIVRVAIDSPPRVTVTERR